MIHGQKHIIMIENLWPAHMLQISGFVPFPSFMHLARIYATSQSESVSCRLESFSSSTENGSSRCKASWGRCDKQQQSQTWCTDFSRSLYRHHMPIMNFFSQCLPVIGRGLWSPFTRSTWSSLGSEVERRRRSLQPGPNSAARLVKDGLSAASNDQHSRITVRSRS